MLLRFRWCLIAVAVLLVVPMMASGVQLDPTSLDKRGELMSGGAIEFDPSATPGDGGFTGTGSPPRATGSRDCLFSMAIGGERSPYQGGNL